MKTFVLSHALFDGLEGEVTTLRSRLGVTGYGVLWSLIECLSTSADLSLSMDYSDLSQRLSCDVETLRSVVEDFSFFEVSDDAISMPRLSEEVAAFNATSIKRRAKARKAALARWGSTSDATSIESVCSEHKSQDACSITRSSTTDCDTPAATRTPSRTRVCSYARAKRNNTSYKTSKSIYKPEKINLSPLTPLSFAAQKSGSPDFDAGEIARLRQEVDGLHHQIDELREEAGNNRTGESTAVRRRQDEESLLATYDEPWRDLVRDWIRYRSEMGAPIRGCLAIGKFHDKLRELSGGDLLSARKIIDRSMANGYKGIELRNPGYTSSRTPRTNAAGKVIDSTVGQDYSRNLSVRECLARRLAASV